MTERKTANPGRVSSRATTPREAEVDETAPAITFTYDGQTYALEPVRQWDIAVLEAIEEERYVSAVKAMLGAEQWAKFKSVRRTMTDLLDIFRTAEQAAGIRPGE